jgi:hypothetical protein
MFRPQVDWKLVLGTWCMYYQQVTRKILHIILFIGSFKGCLIGETGLESRVLGTWNRLQTIVICPGIRDYGTLSCR